MLQRKKKQNPLMKCCFIYADHLQFLLNYNGKWVVFCVAKTLFSSLFLAL